MLGIPRTSVKLAVLPYEMHAQTHKRSHTHTYTHATHPTAQAAPSRQSLDFHLIERQLIPPSSATNLRPRGRRFVALEGGMSCRSMRWKSRLWRDGAACAVGCVACVYV